MSGVTAISAGEFHNLALLSNRTVIAWGNNTNGQISIPSELNGVIAISAGSRATATVRNAYNYSENDIANIPRNLGTLEFDNISQTGNRWTFGTITTDTFIQGESYYILGTMTLKN